jgi:alginate O-acetyltransferase complex protein AlgI
VQGNHLGHEGISLKVLIAIALRAAETAINVTYFAGVALSAIRVRTWQLLVYCALVSVLIVRWLHTHHETRLNELSIAQNVAIPLLWTVLCLVSVRIGARWPRGKKWVLRAAFLSLVVSWTILKYPYLREHFVRITPNMGLRLEDVPVLGASYLLLKLLHILADSMGRQPAQPSGVTLLGMCFFPPTYSLGPMHRYDEFSASFENLPGLHQRDWAEALRRFIWGTFKSTVLAPRLSGLCMPVLASPADYSASSIWLAVYAYALFIYLDFSGMSDVAIGLGKAFGIDVPENFRAPYFQPNIQQFWQSWHMTLTRWLQAYVFMPISRRLMKTRLRQRPRLVAGIGYLVTFSLCGIWHGDGINFLIWGLYHGLGLWVYNVLPKALKASSNHTQVWSVRRFAWLGLTFHFVCFGWVLFQCTPQDSLTVFRRMLGVG